MKRTLFIGMICAALVSFALVAFAADAPKGPKVLEKPAGITAQQGAVTFNHDTHKGDCKVCHHKADAKGGYKCDTKGCHDNFDAKDKTSPNSYYMAYHKDSAKASCIGCHKAEKAAGKDVPVVCNKCHAKKG